MRLPPLHRGTLIRRYKRFLADVRLQDGTEVIAHCPNPGSMKTCWEPGWEVLMTHHTDKKRKLKWTFEVAFDGQDHPILVNTARPNRIVEEAIVAGTIPSLSGYPDLRREVRYGREKSRIDLLLEGAKGRCFVEVKSVTMADTGAGAMFPDSVTARGTRHLRELMAQKAAGDRAVLFFLLSRGGRTHLRPADEIDTVYGETLRQAIAAGVEVIAHRAIFSGGLVDYTITCGEAVPVRT
ncbi:MAG: DNA/RNA nuclease SfsA [Myxococcota bacterium]|nr:DNA/RNA nuclease SfsA [Myxococcota bacterium]